jgi:hypothetical protein
MPDFLFIEGAGAGGGKNTPAADPGKTGFLLSDIIVDTDP